MVKGVDILVMVDTGTTEAPAWTAVAKQRGASLKEKSDTIDVTSKDSNGNKEFEYGLYSWNVSCDGLFVVDDTAYEKLKTAMRDKVKVKLRIKEGTITEEGTALVTSRELEGPYEKDATYQVEFQGTGALTKVVA